MSSFNFKRLIKKYSKSPVYTLKETEGGYDYSQGGIWVPGELERIEFEGSIVPLSKEELEYGEGGTYTTEDKKLYCYIELDKGEKVEHKDLTYTIHEKLDYTDFDSELKIYFIKRGGT